jgi:hypothetical protein
VRFVEALPEDDAGAVTALRTWVLDGYRSKGIPETVVEQYDANTFWPMQVSGIRRWLSSRAD